MIRLPRALLICVLAVCATPVKAQDRPAPGMAIDAGHSYASIWMGKATEVSPPVNVAVAQVAGTAVLDPKNISSSRIDVNLVPGGEGADLLAPDGTIRDGVVARIMRYTVMGFRTAQTGLRRDGRLEFTGQLTVTHVTREPIPAAWNSTYTTPSYTDPTTTSATHPVTFVLSSPRAESLTDSLRKGADFVATASVDAEDFPGLSADILDSYWPIVAQDENCEFPVDTAGRRDYGGAICTGKAVSTQTTLTGQHSFGRDYSGPLKADAPVNGQVTIVLYLKLAAPASKPTRE